MDATEITYPCGCVNKAEPEFGILRSVSKCEFHLAHAGKGGISHYEEMGLIVDGEPQYEKYERELLECIEVPRAPLGADSHCLEIGCGPGVYAPLLVSRGWLYNGIDPDIEIIQWARERQQLNVVGMFGGFGFEKVYVFPTGLIVAAHVLEHFKDAPAMLRKMHEMLVPSGNLVLIVPDDEDPVNPDHLYFFNQQTLTRLLEAVGFKIEQMAIKRRHERENFIYVRAVKV